MSDTLQQVRCQEQGSQRFPSVAVAGYVCEQEPVGVRLMKLSGSNVGTPPFVCGAVADGLARQVDNAGVLP
jgi:hypothetical protein